MQGRVIKVSGPLIVAENMADSKLFDVVRVSDKGLIGEIIDVPESIIRISLSYSTAIMFLPTSPTPPKKVKRKLPTFFAIKFSFFI